MKLVIFDFNGVINTARGISETIRELYAEYLLAIVSSSSTIYINNYLEEEGLTNCFASVLGYDTRGDKIHKIKTLLEKYKTAPEDTLYITDTIGDMIEAEECGVKSVAVTWGFQNEKALRKANPLKIVNNPEDLAKAIEEIL